MTYLDLTPDERSHWEMLRNDLRKNERTFVELASHVSSCYNTFSSRCAELTERMRTAEGTEDHFIVVAECHVDTVDVYAKLSNELEVIDEQLPRSVKAVLDALQDVKKFIHEIGERYEVVLEPEAEIVDLQANFFDACQACDELSSAIQSVPTIIDIETQERDRASAAVARVRDHLKDGERRLDQIHQALTR